MEFLTHINLNDSSIHNLNESNLVYEIEEIKVFSTDCKNTTLNSLNSYIDICGYLFKDSDIICCKLKSGKNTQCKYTQCTKDQIRSAIIYMNSTNPLKPTPESSSILYKMLSGCKKKKSKSQRKEDDDEDEEDDDDEVLRIIRRKDKVKSKINLKSKEDESKKEDLDVDEEDDEDYVEDDYDGQDLEDQEDDIPEEDEDEED
jgi:hypothetical protein